MRKIKFHQVIILLFYALFFILLMKNSLSYLDPDLGWHLKMGEDISIQKRVNYENYYNFIFPESDNYWINHEWLSDFLIYNTYSKLNYIFLNIIFALIIVFSLFILNNFTIREIIPEKRFLLLLLPLESIALKASLPHLGIRIQELSVLFVILLFLIIYKFEKNCLNNKKYYWGILFFLIPLVWFWSNMHAGFLLGISLLFFYLGIKIVEKITYNYPDSYIYKFLSSFLSFEKTIPLKKLSKFFIFSFLVCLSTILNPYGLKLFSFLFQYKNTAYLKIISEWFPQHLYPFMYWQIFYIGIVITLLTVAIISTKKDEKKILSPWNFSIALLFIFLAFKSKRHFPLFFIATLPLVAEILYKDFGLLFKKTTNKIKSSTEIFTHTFLILCFSLSFLSILITTNFQSKPFESFCHNYPCGATNFLKNNPQLNDSKLFNNYSWGGFFINQNPEQKIFIDGRQPQKPLGQHSFIQEYLLFYSENKEQISNKIEEYGLNLFILEKNVPIKLNYFDKNIFGLKEDAFKTEDYLIIFLETNENWENIYEDEISIIYKKK